MRSGPRGGFFFDGEEFVAMLILAKSFPRFKYEGAVVISVISSWDWRFVGDSREGDCLFCCSVDSIVRGKIDVAPNPY